MAESINLNETLSDLTTWDNYRFKSYNVEKNNNDYLVTGRTINAHERIIKKFYVTPNRNYSFTISRYVDSYDLQFGPEANGYILISSISLSGNYFIDDLSQNYKNYIIAKTKLEPYDKTYTIDFNSGPNSELYVSIDFDDLNDYQDFTMLFKDTNVQYSKKDQEYLIESAYKTGYYFDNKGNRIEQYAYMILIRSIESLEFLPQEITPGSWAYTAAGKKVWQMDFDHEWIPAFDEDE